MNQSVKAGRRPARTEREVRVDLAAAYRMAAQNGWDDTVYTHLSASVPGEPGHYLLNPFGATFDEITASSLVKVNVRGEVVDGSTPASTRVASRSTAPCMRPGPRSNA